MGISDSDIFHFLLELRKSGNHNFYSSTEIKDLIKRSKGEGVFLPSSVYRKIRTLYDFGFLDVELYNFTPKWRVKNKYFLGASENRSLIKKQVIHKRNGYIKRKNTRRKAKT